ncbi:MAG: hypothetical protein EOO24_50980 [Comamonadaceae bacterium]|nr:MAG: hypothetical protein EOO24_50980 [Comamonadaceae bacterium]
MTPWTAALREAAVSGTLASACSSAALTLAGRLQSPSAAAPTNATSQWLWGRPEALAADAMDARHTLAGYAVHHLAASFWAVLHARAMLDRPEGSQPVPALAAAALTSAVAACVDLKLMPERLTPGFQHRVRGSAVAASYACFALGLAAGSLAMHRSRRNRR